MRGQDWIFTVHYWTDQCARRHAVVGPGRVSTVEAALHLAGIPEKVRQQIRTCPVVRDLVEGRLDPDKSGYYAASPVAADALTAWVVCVGSVQEILPR